MTKTEPDAGLNEFETEIDSAIDDLFSPSKQIEIDPVTSEVVEVKTPPNEAQPQQDEGRSLDIKGAVERCQQHLLTLEWEVTDANIQLLRDSISKLLSTLAPDKQQLLGDLPSLMDKALDIMQTSPGTMPMNGLKTLQNSLDAIKEMISEGPLWFEMVNSSINGLNELILSETASLSLQSAGGGVHGHAPESETLEVEEIKIDGLEIEEEEDHEIKASPHDMAHDAAPQVLKPEDIIVENKAVEPQPASVIAPITPEMQTAISAHIDALDKCIARMLPIEQLMGRTHGMEKLYKFYKGIREDLTQQIADICRLFPELDHRSPCSKPEATAKDIFSMHMVAEEDAGGRKDSEPAARQCPWQRLAMTSWAGKTVAFVPDEIAFEGRPAWWAQKKICTLNFMPLKMLKAWPWKKIGPMLSGRLGKKDEKELSDMGFPVVEPPWADPSSNRKPMVIILYAAGKGAVFLTDSETILFSTYGNWNWEPGGAGTPYSPGVITNNKGESIPVITLKGLSE